jgi:hypothetical protein
VAACDRVLHARRIPGTIANCRRVILMCRQMRSIMLMASALMLFELLQLVRNVKKAGRRPCGSRKLPSQEFGK